MKNHSSFLNISTPTEKDLSQEEAMTLILNSLEDSFLLVNKELQVVLTNEATKIKAREYFGVTLTHKTPVLDLVPPERRGYLRDLYAQVFLGACKTTESTVVLNGTVLYLENHLKPAKDKEGNIVGVIVSSRNVTEKKQSIAERLKTREDLKFSEQQYKTLFQNNPLPCWIYDYTTLRFLEVNEAAVRHYGYSRKEFEQLTVLDLQVDENKTSLKTRFSTNKIKKVDILNNWEHKLKDGRTIFLDLRSSEIIYRGVKARLVVVHDVTPRVVTESELRKSNERFRLAAKASSEALWEWDVLTGEAYISSTYTDILGWRADEFRKFDEWHDYIHPNDKEATVKSYYTAIEDPGTEIWKREYRYLKADGSYAFVSDKAVIVRDEQGKAVKVIGALKNITAQKEIEEELQKSNERFSLASRATSDHIYEWDIVSNELVWGEDTQTLFGFQPQELTMRVWTDLLHPEERDNTLRNLTEALADPATEIWNQEYRLADARGVYSYILERGFIVRDEEGKAFRMIGSLQDITSRKLQEELLSLERTIFELSSNPAQDILQVVETFLNGIEKIYPEAITAVFLLNEDETVSSLISPRLPAALTSVIKGSSIGPDEGSTGAAMYFKKTVISPDIEKDPVYMKYGALARQFNLKACWAFPIIHTAGKTMGSFSVYYETPHAPSAAQVATFERFRNILRIIMENRWSLQEIKTANERFDIMMNATNDLVWDWDLETNRIYRDPMGLQKVYGVENNDAVDSIHQFLQRIHPEDREKVTTVIDNILKYTEKNFEVEYRFQKDDGTYSHVYDRGIIIRGENKKPVRMIGAAQDISERKRLEKELLSNELEYQRAINRATVETQEQERTEIGKELHDNVNQVLTTTKLYLDLALTNAELKDELIQKSTKNIVNVINEIRQLSRSLMDPSIGDLGLIDSIYDLIENINLTRKLHVSLSAGEEIEDLLNKNQKLTIFRIIQEALNNAIRHARANNVQIRIFHKTSSARVIIEDDGIGFDVKTVKKGVGLRNIQNRIYLINGDYSIESVINKGSKIIINFPINQTNTLYPH